MTTADHATYAFIPPPPLPQFYAKERKDNTIDSTSSSASTVELGTKDVAAIDSPLLVDGAYDGRPRPPKLPRGPPTPLMTIPPPPLQTAGAKVVPPLAIYHICRLCLRPRSPRYHKEHPIPIDGLPPPPGICRRCRVTSLEETKRVAEIVKESESNEIKIGFIQPFVSDKDIISNEEMKEINAENYLRRLSSERISNHHQTRPLKDIAYRHFRVLDEPEVAPSKRRTKVTVTRHTVGDTEHESTSRSLSSETRQVPVTTTASMEVASTKNPARMPATTVKVDSKQPSTSSSSSSSKPKVKASTKVAKLAQPEYAEFDVREIAREEIERYRHAYWKAERSDSNIRKIARDEIERYRQAERKLEAHPDPYAHGRMVPVERRIEREGDVADPAPWTEAGKKGLSALDVPDEVRAFLEGYITLREEQHQKYRERRQKRRRREREERRREIDEESRSSTSSESSSADDSRIERLCDGLEAAKEWYLPRSSTSTEPSTVKTERKEPSYLRKFTESLEEERPRNSTPTESRKLDLAGEQVNPREPPTQQRARKEAIDVERRQVREHDQTPKQPSASQGEGISSRSSKQTGRKNRHDENPRTSVRIFSRPLNDHATSGSADREPGIRSDRQRQETNWPETQDAQRAAPTLRSGQARGLPYPEHDSPIDRIVRPIDEATDRSFRSEPPRSGRSARDNGTEYLYAERIVQPAHRSPGRRPFNDHPPARHVEVEEVTEWTRNPVEPATSRKKDRSHQRDRFSSVYIQKANPSKVEQPRGHEQKEHVSIERSQDRPPSNKPSEKDVNTVRASKQERDIPSRQNTKGDGFGEKSQQRFPDTPISQTRPHNTGKQDPRVQFSNKVDISPTPPGSDASSSEIRRFHRVGRESGQYVDGNHSPKSYKDSIEEYERRGRMRSRELGTCPDPHDERGSSRERGRYRDAPTASNKKRQDWRRRLDRALSESPSREESLSSSKLDDIDPIQDGTRLAKAGLRVLGDKAKSSVNRGIEKLEDKLDGRGPYRDPEKVTDSMRVEDASPERRVWDRSERSSRHRRDV